MSGRSIGNAFPPAVEPVGLMRWRLADALGAWVLRCFGQREACPVTTVDLFRDDHRQDQLPLLIRGIATRSVVPEPDRSPHSSARAAYGALARQVDAVMSVTAPGAASVGLETTGNPVFVEPGSMLGAPA